MKLVTAETLAASLRRIHGSVVPLPNRATVEDYAALLIEWLPPDPRLDALLAWNERLEDSLDRLADAAFNRRFQRHGEALLTEATKAAMALLAERNRDRDALAAFKESV
jgi:hypothetical protein